MFSLDAVIRIHSKATAADVESIVKQWLFQQGLAYSSSAALESSFVKQVTTTTFITSCVVKGRTNSVKENV
ncbi:hypothetical protein QE152_g18905 [Popillia japonica]|uniref:Uncharacterized protein n=1 Tax=Popillia japonica TaxID=7064 RepID=A0AAW1L3L2_POPJA